MPGLYSVYKVWSPGDILTAADLNASELQHVTFQTCQATDDFSATLAEHETQSADLTSLSTSLAGELASLRKALALLGGVSVWDAITGPYVAALSQLSRVSRLQSTGGFTTANGQLTLTADTIQFSGGSVIYNQTGVALDIGAASPAPNARDQAGNFLSQDIHIYWIKRSGPTVIALLGSVNGPAIGPSLPSPYNEFAYATTIRVGATANRWSYAGYVRGSHVYGDAFLGNISGLSATVATAQSVSTMVPAIASVWDAVVLFQCTTVAGAASSGLQMYWNTGTRFVASINIDGLGAGTYQARHYVSMPNVGQSFTYLLTNTTGVGQASLDLESYTVPNGDT